MILINKYKTLSIKLSLTCISCPGKRKQNMNHIKSEKGGHKPQQKHAYRHNTLRTNSVVVNSSKKKKDLFLFSRVWLLVWHYLQLKSGVSFTIYFRNQIAGNSPFAYKHWELTCFR